MVVFMQEYSVNLLNYNWITSVVLFSCCLLKAIWLDALEFQGIDESKWIGHYTLYYGR